MSKSGKHRSLGTILKSLADFVSSLFHKAPTSHTLLQDPLSGLGEELAKLCRDRSDVLVGTVRNEEQLDYNLSQKCYYVPGRFLTQRHFPIHYIALYEWDEEDNACICRVGRVLSTRELARRTIPVSMRPESDPKELYYSFTVEDWVPLPRKIRIKDTVRGRPLFTNHFLLEHCQWSWELFTVSSATEYGLLVSIHKLLEKGEPSCVYAPGTKRTIALQNGCLLLCNKRGKTLIELPVQQYKDCPRLSFLSLKKYLKP
ncbi:MAG: hypothetical protein IKT58_04070 [Oscillospiraceae bacterium]|nr:hypothetical protein [Oscillospiraceae bacterium]